MPQYFYSASIFVTRPTWCLSTKRACFLNCLLFRTLNFDFPFTLLEFCFNNGRVICFQSELFNVSNKFIMDVVADWFWYCHLISSEMCLQREIIGVNSSRLLHHHSFFPSWSFIASFLTINSANKINKHQNIFKLSQRIYSKSRNQSPKNLFISNKTCQKKYQISNVKSMKRDTKFRFLNSEHNVMK